MKTLWTITMLVNAAGAAPVGPSPHELEVMAFASTLAITRIASDRCADILVDTTLVRWLGQQAHFVKEHDAPLLAAEVRSVTAALDKAIAEAPSLQAWCDATYRLYGPDGRIIPGLMLRQRDRTP